MSKKIGLLLGTFDPMHIGHVSVITEAFNVHGIDEIVIVPAWHNPWKGDSVCTFEQRYEMCRLVAEELNRFYGQDYEPQPRIGASDIERTMSVNGTVYSSDVLGKAYDYYVKERGMELYLLCGSDVAAQIKDWHEGQWILDHVKLLEVGRIGSTDNIVEHGIKVSSTVIRKMLSDGICPLPYVPTVAYSYIQEHKLYQ